MERSGGAGPAASGRGAILCGLALLAAGCAHLKPPEEGGPAWVELSSDHFTLRTDLGLDEAKQQLDEVERLFAAEVALAWPVDPASVALERRLPMVVFRNVKELRPFTRDDRGYRRDFTTAVISRVSSFGGKDVVGEPLFVTHGEQRLVESSGLRGGVSWMVVAPFAARLPAWVSIGVAGLLSGATIDEGGVTIGRLGRTPQAIPSAALLRASDVAAADSPNTCLLLVHFLRTTRSAAYAGFLRRLLAGADEELAFTESFPDLDPEGLDRQLEEQRRNPRQVAIRQPLGGLRAAPQVALLSFAEVHATWAEVAAGGNGRTPLEEPELSRALALDPDNVTARLLRSRGTAGRLTELRALAKLHPEDPRPAILLSQESRDPAEILAQARRLLASRPAADGPRRLELSALAALGRTPEAATSARLLLGNQGADPSDLVLAAQVFDRTGDCPAATAALARAAKLERRRGGGPSPLEQQLAKQLGERCKPAGSAPQH